MKTRHAPRCQNPRHERGAKVFATNTNAPRSHINAGPGAPAAPQTASHPHRCSSTTRSLPYEEPQLAALVLAIGTINLWNRVNVITRQVAGQGW